MFTMLNQHAYDFLKSKLDSNRCIEPATTLKESVNNVSQNTISM
jgi:hypothetical protein